EQMAKDNQVPKSANMILLGMATRYIEILTPEQMRSAIARIFARKGEQVVNDNLKAFDLGYENIQ
ncbi:MAG: 2-oxoacid:acceptor oxidoreductase family protein, partial [Bacteroidaceae bacterium]|nr:2-oxoacid:acceptor oxidoreductase family protein [Bacteroidaceae bacterium]